MNDESIIEPFPVFYIDQLQRLEPVPCPRCKGAGDVDCSLCFRERRVWRLRRLEGSAGV